MADPLLQASLTTGSARPILQTLKLGSTPQMSQITPALDYTAVLETALEAQLEILREGISQADLTLSLLVCSNGTAEAALSQRAARQALLSDIDEYISGGLAVYRAELAQLGYISRPEPTLFAELAVARQRERWVGRQHDKVRAATHHASPSIGELFEDIYYNAAGGPSHAS